MIFPYEYRFVPVKDNIIIKEYNNPIIRLTNEFVWNETYSYNAILDKRNTSELLPAAAQLQCPFWIHICNS